MNALTSRVSAPLAVCLLGAAIAGLMLFRSPQATVTPAPSTSATSGDEPTSPTGDVATIEIAGFAFDGASVVSAGQTISVPNADSAPHTLTSVDGLFDTGLIDGGGEGSLVAPAAPGTYAYFCALHPSMTGTFTVG